MKKILIILFFLPLFSIAQDYTQYLPKVAWSTYFDNVVFVNTDTFTVDVLPLDLSEPGAFPLVNGKYIVDNRGLRYEVIDTTSYPTLTVVDIFKEGFAPFSGKIGYAYVGADGSPSLTSYGFEKLDPKAFSYAYAIDMNIIWAAAIDSVREKWTVDTLIIEGERIVPKTSYILTGLSEEQQSLNVIVNGANVYMETEAVGTGDITYIFNEQKYVLDCTTGAGVGGMAQVLLTQGTATDEQINYVYVVPTSVGVATLTTSTSFPTDTFAWHSLVVLQDTATITAQGAINLQRMTEALKHDGRGQLSHIREKIRWLGAKWLTGCAATLANGAVMNLSVAGGVVNQLHRQNFPPKSVVTNGITVANASGVGALTKLGIINDLNTIGELADGTAIGNNKYFSVTIWATMASSEGGVNRSELFVNLPTGFYNSLSEVIGDVNNYDVRTASPEYNNTAFLICRVTFKKTTTTHTPVGLEVYSLLGNPMGSQGGGAGSTALTEFSDALFRIYNNTDPTKVVAFDASAITTGTVRTYTLPDASGTVALTSDLSQYQQDSDTTTFDGTKYDDRFGNTAYNDKINSLAFTGITTKTLTLTQQDGGTVTGSFTSIDYTVQTLSGTLDTLDVNLGLHGLHTMGNLIDTIFLDNLVAGMNGNIEINCRASADSLFFLSDSIVWISPYLFSVNKKIPVTNSATGNDTYSYWFTGHKVKINGTKNYE